MVSCLTDYDNLSNFVLYLGYLMKIPGLKILRVYGQEIERKVFPVPDKITLFRSKRVSVQLKADEDLKDVSLHHVIRSRDCPFASEIKDYDEEFKKYTGYNSNAPRRLIGAFNKVTFLSTFEIEN